MQCEPKTTLVLNVSQTPFVQITVPLLVFQLYYFMRKLSLRNTRYWPHLVIYLDAPVKSCLERIKQRGRPNEIAVVDEKYLGVMEDSYKDALREFK